MYMKSRGEFPHIAVGTLLTPNHLLEITVSECYNQKRNTTILILIPFLVTRLQANPAFNPKEFQNPLLIIHHDISALQYRCCPAFFYSILYASTN